MEATSSTVSMLSTLRDDGTTGRNMKSRQGKKDVSQKLEDINKQLNDVREKRSKLKSFDNGRIYGPKRDYTTVPKKLFSHPKLDYVYGEIMFSPYMTNPQDNYPKETYKMAETLKEMKRKNVSFKDLPPEEKPYDETLLKRSFIREVCNYNPKFNVAKSMRSMNESIKGSRPGTSSSSSIKGLPSISSSVSSLKSSRGPLNKLTPRRQPSATSISLDSSGFTPSPAGSIKAKNALLLKQQHQQQQQVDSPGLPALDTMAQAMADAAASLSETMESKPAESSIATTVTAEQATTSNTNSLEEATSTSLVATDGAEYEEDFDQPATDATVSASAVTDGAEYEEDFDQPATDATVSASAVTDGADYEEDFDQPATDPTVSASAVTDGAEYEEDFDQQGVSPPKDNPVSAHVDAPPVCQIEEQTAAAGEEAYETDFEATGTLPSTSSATMAAAVAADSTQEEDKNRNADEDFEQNVSPTVVNTTTTTSIPAVVPAVQPAPDAPTVAVTTSVDIALTVAAAGTATAPGVLSSEIPEVMEAHTARSTLAPSTVRSDYYPNQQIPTPALSHASSARVLDRGNSAELDALLDEEEHSTTTVEHGIGIATASTKSAVQIVPIPSLPVGSASVKATVQEGASAVEAASSPVKDTTEEPIDEILYVESSGQSAKEGQTRSNNYLQSPVREDIRRSRTDSVPEEELETGDPGNSVPVALSSPVPGQKALSDEEIGEEIEG